MKRALPIVFVLVLAVPAWAQDAYDPPPEGAFIESIEFTPEGLRGELVDLLELFEEGNFSARAARNSIRNIMRLGIYSNVRIAWTAAADGIHLHFIVDEVPLIEGVTILGNGPISKQRVVSAARLDNDLRYNQIREQRLVRLITETYRVAGYYDAGVSIFSMVNLETNGIRLEINIDAGEQTILGALDLSGFPIFTPDEIFSELKGIGIGEPFREVEFRGNLDAIRGFYTQKGYLAADIGLTAVDYDPEQNTVTIAMTINAGPIIRTFFEPEVDDPQRWLDLIPFADQNVPVDSVLDNGKEKILQNLQRTGNVDASVEIDWEIVPEEAALGVTVSIDRGLVHSVKGLRFEGIPAEMVVQLLPQLNLSKKGWFSTPRFSMLALAEDIDRTKRFLAEQGFPEADVVIDRTDEGEEGRRVQLTLRIEPGPQARIGSMRFTGNGSLSPEQLQHVMDLQEGDVLTAMTLGNAVQAAQVFYDEEGFVDTEVRVTVSGDVTERVLDFEITEGTQAMVRKIIIAGNSITEEGVIRESLTFREGDAYSLQSIAESQRTLYRKGIFELVTINAFDDEISRGDKRVVVTVRETRPYTLLYGFGLDSEEKFRFSFGFSNNNINGQNVEAGFSARVSQRQQRYQLSFSSPRLFRGLVDNRLRLFYEELLRSSHGLRRRGLIYETTGINWRDWNIIAQVQYKWIDTFDVIPGVQINRFEEPVRLTLFSGIFLRDTRDDPLDPTNGSLTNVVFQVSPQLLGGDISYVRTEGQYYLFRTVWPTVVLAGGLRIGTAIPFEEGELIPISERFFLGGSNSLRGFPLDGVGPEFVGADGGFYPQGGNALVNGNVELRFPLLAGFGGVTFYDFGQVYSFIDNIDLGDLEHAIGIGIRIGTPLGPLRFDYGYSLTTDDNQLYFTFGHAF